MSLIDSASLILTPNAYKEGKLYSVIPSDGSGDFTFTRATTATRVNSDGLVELVPYNLLSYSEQFDNAYWTKRGSTITANVTTAPDGQTTADELKDDTSSFLHDLFFEPTGYAENSYFTLSAFVKANTISACRLIASQTGNVNYAFASFNLSTKATTATLSGTFTNPTSKIDTFPNGWLRVSLTFQTGSGGALTWSSSGCSIRLEKPYQTQIYTGTGQSLYVWGAQLELGSTATTYQPIATTQQAFISSQFKYNLVNPVDSDAAFRLVFNGGWTHSSTGATPNGTNGYADTKLVPSSSLSTTSAHFTTYLRTNSTGATCDIGSFLSNARMILYSRYPSSETYATISNSGYPIGVPFSTTDSTGFWQTIRENNTNTKIFQNTIKKADGAVAFSTLPNVPFYIGAVNNTSVASLFSNRQTSFSTIGNGLTDTEAANLYTRVQAFQTSLSRQV